MATENAFQKCYAPYVDTWSPRLLQAMVNQRRIVFAPIKHQPGATCRVTLDDEGLWYLIAGPTGVHRLSVRSTDAARLQAHWDWFCQQNGVAPFRR